MTILSVTDIHGRLDHLSKVRNEAARADLILISGDITNFGGRPEVQEIIEMLFEINRRILAVTGNCDRRGVEPFLKELEIDLHAVVREVQEFSIAGLSGSLPGPGLTPNTYDEDELRGFLDSIRPSKGRPFIFVSHQPPFDTPADRIASGRHVGSRAVREFIERTRPVLCLTGHIHESIGQGDLAGCRVVNPGPFSQGRYALVEIEGDKEPIVRIGP